MSDVSKYLFIGTLGLLVAAGLIQGIRAAIAERREVWNRLRAQYQVANSGFGPGNELDSVLGSMFLDGCEFVGHASIVDQGILFRRDRWSGYELLLFPWSLDFSALAESDSLFLTARLGRKFGGSEEVKLPWSDSLETERARHVLPQTTKCS